MAGSEAKGASIGPPSGAIRYDVQIDPASNTSHAQILAMVPAGTRVLELGAATGSTTELLRERDCRVTTVEVDPEAAARGSAWSERALVADFDHDDLPRLLGDDVFDVVIAADVLEHLKDPVATLRQASRLLGPEGFCLVSVPNVAHGSMRLALLDGRWDYTDRGLLDRTHLRFFTRAGVDDLFDAADYDVEEIRTVERGLTDTWAADFDTSLLEGPIGAHVTASPDATTFQFVARATPRTHGAPRPIPPRSLADEQARLVRTLLLRARASEETIREQHSQLSDQSRRLAGLDAEVERLSAMLDAEQRKGQQMQARLRVIDRLPVIRAASLLRRVVRQGPPRSAGRMRRLGRRTRSDPEARRTD